MPEKIPILERINKKTFSGWDILTIVLLFILYSVFQIATYKSTLLFIITGLLIAYIFVMTIRKSIKRGEDTLKLTPKTFLCIIGFFALLLGFAVIINLLMPANNAPENQRVVANSLLASPIKNSIAIIIIVPMIEELIFRYFPLKEGKALNLRIVIFAILFLLAHTGLNFAEMPYYIPITVGLTLVRIYYNSVRASYIYHIMQNTISTVMVLLAI